MLSSSSEFPDQALLHPRATNTVPTSTPTASNTPADAYTAESLCAQIISQGVIAIEIDRWYNGGWEGQICGLPFNDFNIQPGTGYFIKSSSTGTVR